MSLLLFDALFTGSWRKLKGRGEFCDGVIALSSGAAEDIRKSNEKLQKYRKRDKRSQEVDGGYSHSGLGELRERELLLQLADKTCSGKARRISNVK